MWVLKYQNLASGQRRGAWVAEVAVWKPGSEVGVLAQHLQWLPLAWRKQPQGQVEGIPGVQRKILGQEAGWGPGGCYMGGNREVAAARGGPDWGAPDLGEQLEEPEGR